MKTAKLRKGKPETIGRCYVYHCGHPTALWPWALLVDGELIAAPNGLAFQRKRDAVAAAHLVESGALQLFDRGLGPNYPRVLTVDTPRGSWSKRDVARAWKLIERGNA